LELDEQVSLYERRQNEPPFVVLTVQEPRLLAARFTPLDPVSLANGATLIGWRLDEIEEGARLRLQTYWRMTGQPVNDHFQQFNHVYSPGDSEPAAIADIYTSSHAWQPGDHVITWAEFDRPHAGISHIDVGMYTWPALARVPFRTAAGHEESAIRLSVAAPPD
jgi:hypothetical protein